MMLLNFIYRYFGRKRNKNYDDCKNVVNSIAKAKSLHKRLIVLDHPDKNPDKVELATKLSELVNENRYNYSELLKLEERIKNELL